MAQAGQTAWYQARAFAELAGVTVRTLHHYDQLGLLKPRRRSSKGYRLYRMEDLERLEQIAALQFLGLSLAEIRQVLEQKAPSIGEELDRQQKALLEKRRLLDGALRAIDEAQVAIHEGKPTAVLLRRIINAMDQYNDANWMMKYYSPSAQKTIAERANSFTPEMQAAISEAWKQYYRDLAALQEQDDPEGTTATELASRHRELLAAFTGNDPEVESGLRALYSDRANWPIEMQERMAEYERSRVDE